MENKIISKKSSRIMKLVVNTFSDLEKEKDENKKATLLTMLHNDIEKILDEK